MSSYLYLVRVNHVPHERIVPDFTEMGDVQIFRGDSTELALRFLYIVRKISQEAQARGERARIGLSGGSVAEAFLPVLAEQPELSSQLEVFWCDERVVPLYHEQSNYRRARELWLDPCRLNPDSVFPLSAEPNMTAGARNYEAKLQERPKRPLDLALLGVGPDGHIASLFFEHPALESHRWVETVADSPKPPPQRLTLTLELFKQVPYVVVAAFGASKAQAMAEARAPDSRSPVGRLVQSSPRVDVLVDESAAALMNE